MKRVDVAINVYGKPFQTAVTLLSLLKQSGQWIETIYFVQERKQPEPADFSWLLKRLRQQVRVVEFQPEYFLWCNAPKWPWLVRFAKNSPAFDSLSICLGNDGQGHLFITHNDVLYTGDIVGRYLSLIGSHIAVGQIGQCWNCPASKAGKCDGSRYLEYRPSSAEYEALVREFKPVRGGPLPYANAWPLPECRVNEWFCLINLQQARAITLPKGRCAAFGQFDQDIGTKWFYDVHQVGRSAVHDAAEGFAIHEPSFRSGHGVLLNPKLYEVAESNAKTWLKEEFGIDPHAPP